MEEILEAEDESREKKKGERWRQKRQGRRRIDGYHLLTGMDVSRHDGKRLGIIHIHPWMDRAVRWIKETQPLWIMESTRFNQHPPPPLLSAGHRLLIRSSHLLHLFSPPPTGPTRRSIHETSKLGNGIFRTLKVYIYILIILNVDGVIFSNRVFQWVCCKSLVIPIERWGGSFELSFDQVSRVLLVRVLDSSFV